MRVRFNDLEEFQAKLGLDRGFIERELLRVTKLSKAREPSGVRSIYVVAGALACDHLVELQIFCGEDLGKKSQISEQTYQRAETLLTQLDTWAQGQGLKVRAGLFLPDKEELG